jgi:ATP-binding cassette, subfamily B, bacterial MsbA
MDPNIKAWPIIRALLIGDGRRHIGGYALAFVFMAITAAATSLTAYLMKDVINDVFIGKDMKAVYTLAATVTVIYLAKGFATFGQQVTLARIGTSIIAHYQKRLYEHLLTQDMTFFATKHSSDMLARLTAAAEGAKNVLQAIVLSAGRDVLTLIGLGTVMIIQNPLMAVMALIALPIGALGIGQMIRRVRKFAKRGFEGTSRILGIMQETIQGLRMVKAFQMEKALKERMQHSIEEVRASTNKLLTIAASASPVSETIGGFVIAGVILYGGQQVIVAGESPGTFFSFIASLLLAYEPAKRLGRLNLEIQNGLIGASLLFEVLSTPSGEKDDPEAKPLQLKQGKLEFKNVSFAYRTGEVALNDVSLQARAGETIALVGPSGGGKSTILSLCLRLYDPQSGAIIIDGQDIRHVTRSSLRDAFCIVAQDVFLFRGTIRDNIAFGRPEASMEEIMQAAKAAQAHDFISDFTDGYDTDVGELGSQLSGGQRQRVGIARAILKNAPIVLLDEPTAALDQNAERGVQEALANLTKGRTTIIVAHRLHTVRHADRIYFIENGAVAEQGSREELIKRQGAYYMLETGQANLAPR